MEDFLFGIAGVFWLCGSAGVFLAVWESGCVFGCVRVWVCGCVFGCVGVCVCVLAVWECRCDRHRMDTVWEWGCVSG